MNADPHTINSAPRKALSASLAASTPLVGASRRPERSWRAQSGAEGFGSARLAPMAPEPCDTAAVAPADWAVREQRTRIALGVSPCGWLDVLGQSLDGRPIRDVAVTGGVL